MSETGFASVSEHSIGWVEKCRLRRISGGMPIFRYLSLRRTRPIGAHVLNASFNGIGRNLDVVKRIERNC